MRFSGLKNTGLVKRAKSEWEFLLQMNNIVQNINQCSGNAGNAIITHNSSPVPDRIQFSSQNSLKNSSIYPMAFFFSSNGGDTFSPSPFTNGSLRYFRNAKVDARYEAWYMALNSSSSIVEAVPSAIAGRGSGPSSVCLVPDRVDGRLKPYRRMQVKIVRVMVFLFSERTVSAALGGVDENSGFTSEGPKAGEYSRFIEDSKNGVGVFFLDTSPRT